MKLQELEQIFLLKENNENSDTIIKGDIELPAWGVKDIDNMHCVVEDYLQKKVDKSEIVKIYKDAKLKENYIASFCWGSLSLIKQLSS